LPRVRSELDLKMPTQHFDIPLPNSWGPKLRIFNVGWRLSN